MTGVGEMTSLFFTDKLGFRWPDMWGASTLDSATRIYLCLLRSRKWLAARPEGLDFIIFRTDDSSLLNGIEITVDQVTLMKVKEEIGIIQ